MRQYQDNEETARENKKKKVKKEAALFKRHIREVQARMRELRTKEDLKRQEAYLDEACNERLSKEEQEAEWDPIEDVIKDERGNFVDLIKHILLLTEAVDGETQPRKEEASASGTTGTTAIEGETSEALTTTTSSKEIKETEAKDSVQRNKCTFTGYICSRYQTPIAEAIAGRREALLWKRYARSRKH